jgi:hypothetical protein
MDGKTRNQQKYKEKQNRLRGKKNGKNRENKENRKDYMPIIYNTKWTGQ